MAQPSIPPRRWQLPEILLVVAVCFAMGAIGFFLAVYLQLRSGSAAANAQQASVQDKIKISAQPYDRGDGTVTNAPATAAAPERNQIDVNDPNAAAKLKLMQQPVQR